MKISQALQVIDTEGKVIKRAGSKRLAIGFGKNDLVMLTRVARQEDHLMAAGRTPVGDEETKSTGVKLFHSRNIADLDLKVA